MITAHLCCYIILVAVGLDKDLELSSMVFHQSNRDSASRLALISQPNDGFFSSLSRPEGHVHMS